MINKFKKLWLMEGNINKLITRFPHSDINYDYAKELLLYYKNEPDPFECAVKYILGYSEPFSLKDNSNIEPFSVEGNIFIIFIMF